jgi:hypothetical protein
LNYLRPDLYNRAVDDQLGVIGNDFRGEEKLTQTKNDNSFEITGTATDYLAVTGYKTTLCGKLVIHVFRSGGKDDDMQNNCMQSKSALWTSNYIKIRKEI